MGNRKKNKDTNEHVDTSLGSILFSVLLVALAIGFVFGFKYFLAAGYVTNWNSASEAEEEEDPNGNKMEKDQNFKYDYVMIQSLKGKKLYATEDPGDDKSAFTELEEGQILKVQMRGHIDGILYYLLDNGLYIKDDPSIMPLKEYVDLKGYLIITYISSSGVQLRKWADFHADNIVSSVYVGDKVDVMAKVLTAKDTAAFVTTEGYYITADSRYLNDHTTVVQD